MQPNIIVFIWLSVGVCQMLHYMLFIFHSLGARITAVVRCCTCATTTAATVRPAATTTTTTSLSSLTIVLIAMVLASMRSTVRSHWNDLDQSNNYVLEKELRITVRRSQEERGENCLFVVVVVVVVAVAVA